VSRMTAAGGGLTFQDDLYVRDGDTGNGTDPGTIGDGTIDGLSKGTLTAITDAANPAAAVSQCYAYNGLNRLESAWTIAGSGSGCASSFAGNSTNPDGSATAYASAWDYSTAGSITSVDDLLAPTTRTYTPDTVHPAAAASITTPEIAAVPAEGEDPGSPAVPAVTDTFAYDALGRQIERVTDAGGPAESTLTLVWDASSNLVKTVMDDAEVVYVYDSSGQRVAQMGVTAATATAYLGATEVTDPDTGVNADLVADPNALDGSTFITGTRYYALGGATVATRTGSSLSFLFGDVQGSAQVMVTHTIAPDGTLDAITENSVSRNAYAPYGTTRGAGTSADNDGLAISRGWLNQVSDEASTGLVYLNARYYDPAVARFVSPDPLMNPSDPKTLDPYRYAENNPISFTDATGLFACPAWMPPGVCDASNAAAAASNNAANSKGAPPSTGQKIGAATKGVGKAIWNTIWGVAVEPLLVTQVARFAASPSFYFQEKWDLASSLASGWWNGEKSSWSLLTGGGQTWSGHWKQLDRDFLGGVFQGDDELAKWETGAELGTYVVLALVGPKAIRSIGVKPGLAASTETTTLFRSVNPGEAADIASSGAFKNPPEISLKYFATNAEDARTWGNFLNPGESTTVCTRVPTSALDGAMFAPRWDGIGPAWILNTEQLPRLNQAMTGITVVP
jgi:RHS repeat-associated protein